MMRRHLLAGVVTIATLIGLSLAPREARAADATFTVNPVDLVNGYVNFELETAVGPFVSFHAGLDFLVWDGVWSDSEDEVFAMGPLLGLRLFPFFGAPAGLWIGPYAGISYVRVAHGQLESTGAGSTVGGMVGYTLILADIFVGSAGIGAGYSDFTRSIDGDVVGRRGWDPRFRLALGFAF